jgi:hypothetical protein
MGYRGTGGEPPPANKGAGGQFKKPAYFFGEKVKGQKGPELKRISPFKVGVGQKDVPVVGLDEKLDYAVRIHPRFKAAGVFGNYAVCISKTDSRGCPLDAALNEEGGRWFLVGTVIDRSKWSPPNPSAKNKGKVWTDNRRLLLIPRPQVEEMEGIVQKVGGFRGAKFFVSRTSEKTSSRIGTTWFPDGKMTEEQMKQAFEKAAANYGMPVEKYIQPFDYDSILKAKPYVELQKIAQEIAADTSDMKDEGDGEGDDGEGEPIEAGENAAESPVSYG